MLSAPERAQEQPPRVDASAKVSGAAVYVEDLPELPGTLYAATLRSPLSHARILSIDTSAAEELPGFVAVLHRDNLADFGVQPNEETQHQNFVATDKVRFDGDLVAMVVAQDLKTARRAAQLIDVQYESLPPVFSVVEALAPDAPLVHEALGTNLTMTEELEWGNPDAAFAAAAQVFEECFSSPNIFHDPIEPATSFVVSFGDSGFELWVPTNHPWAIVEEGAKALGVDPERIRVHVPYVGGNFGGKDESVDLTLVAAALARKLARPVKLVATIGESFRMTARHAIDYKARIGVDATGKLLALDVRLDVDTGAYFTGAAIVTNNALNSSSGAYRIPNFRVRARTAYTNKVPAATFRNTGKTQTTFGVDCCMDSVARKLGIDPIEFRRRNVLRKGERMAPETWRRGGREAVAELTPVDTDLPDLIDRAVDAMGWRKPAPAPKEGSHVRRGRGMGVSLRRGSHVGVAEAAAAVDGQGAITILHNAPDVGEGSHTMIRTVAATAFGIAHDQVRVAEPDTAMKLVFSGTNSQRTTVQMGNAVLAACEALKQKLSEVLAGAAGIPATELRFAAGSFEGEGRRWSLSDVARLCPGGQGTSASGAYQRTRTGHESFGGHDHWAPGVGAVEIEVDTQTGEIRLLRYMTLADAGKVLHYRSAKGQLEGGAVMGMGIALCEELLYEDGQLLNADPFQYRLPLLREVPRDTRVLMVENGDGPGPFGSKAIAQVSISCVSPAVCNALYDALGVRLTSTPFTPEKVLRALGLLASGAAE